MVSLCFSLFLRLLCSSDCCVSLLWSRHDAKLTWNSLLVYFCVVSHSPSRSHAKAFHMYWRNAVDFLCAVRRIASLKSTMLEVVSCRQRWSVGPILGYLVYFITGSHSTKETRTRKTMRRVLLSSFVSLRYYGFLLRNVRVLVPVATVVGARHLQHPAASCYRWKLGQVYFQLFCTIYKKRKKKKGIDSTRSLICAERHAVPCYHGSSWQARLEHYHWLTSLR